MQSQQQHQSRADKTLEQLEKSLNKQMNFSVIWTYVFLLIVGVSSTLGSSFLIQRLKESSTNYCRDEFLTFTNWSQCDVLGYQTRSIANAPQCTIPANVLLKQKCVLSSASLFKKGTKEYTTLVDPESKEHYAQNNENLSISIEGEFSTAKLVVTGITTIKDGSPYKIGEFYYYFFGMDESLPHVIGTSRISSNRLDTKDYGIFQGTETPKQITFDLSNIKIAASGKIGSENKNYLEIMNQKSGKTVSMTLFLADGDSMTKKNEDERIFATITDAYIEYQCKNGTSCRIRRIPELPSAQN